MKPASSSGLPSANFWAELDAEPASSFWNELGSEPKADEPHTDLLSRSLQLGRGAVKGVVGMADLANQFVAAPVANLVGGAVELAGGNPNAIYEQRDRWASSHLRDQVAEQVDTLTGGRSRPTDALGRILETTGEFAVPIPLGGQIAKALGKSTSKLTAAEHIAGAAGAATVMEATQEIAPDGIIADLTKVIVGDVLGRKALSLGQQKSLKALGDLGLSILAKPLAIGAKPNPELLRLAKEEGIKLPAQVQLNSKLGNFVANNLLKSVFASKAWNTVLKDADQGMMQRFSEVLDTVHPNLHSPESASQLYRQELQVVSKDLKQQADTLYEATRATLNGTEHVEPTHTIQAIWDLRKKLTAPVPSADMRWVKSRLTELGKAWGVSSPQLDALAQDTPQAFEQIIQAFKKQPPQRALQELIDQRSAFLRDLDYGENAQGVRAFLKPVVRALEQDIVSTPNAAFRQAWKTANQFYKSTFAGRIKTDLARSLLNGEAPKEAFAFMNTVPGVRTLEHMLGSAPKAQEIITTLKRAKLQDVIGRIVTSDTISYAQLAQHAQAFRQHDLLKELMGKQYPKFQRLGKIASGFVQSGKDMANPSGTAISGKDMGILGGFFWATSFLKSVGYASSINLISRLFTNDKLLSQAVQLAMAQKNNTPKRIELLTRQLLNGLQIHQQESQ